LQSGRAARSVFGGHHIAVDASDIPQNQASFREKFHVKNRFPLEFLFLDFKGSKRISVGQIIYTKVQQYIAFLIQMWYTVVLMKSP